MSRLSAPEGAQLPTAAKDPAPHVLNAVTFSGHRYLNRVVIECALYLYEKLLSAEPIPRPRGDIHTFSFGVARLPGKAESRRPVWAGFQGTMMVSFSGSPSVVSHKIRAATWLDPMASCTLTRA